MGSQQIKFLDAPMTNIITEAKPGELITIELKAALNQDWNKVDKGWVDIVYGNDIRNKLEVVETGANTGLFVAKLKIPQIIKSKTITVSYGYLGLGKTARINIR